MQFKLSFMTMNKAWSTCAATRKDKVMIEEKKRKFRLEKKSVELFKKSVAFKSGVADWKCG